MDVNSDVTAGVLVLSSLLFFVGASLAPEPGQVFSAPLHEHLRILARHRRRWSVMNTLMIGSIVTTTIGLVLFAVLQFQRGDSFRAIVAASGYTAVGVLWSLSMSFRQTTMIAVAEAVQQNQPVPDWLPPLQRWTGQMYWIYVVVAYGCLALMGWSLLATGTSSAAVGWFAIGFGIIGAAGFVTEQPNTPVGALFDIPALIHFVPFVIGIALWL